MLIFASDLETIVKLSIMTRNEFNANKKYLLEDCNNIFWNGQAWDEEPFSVELESYTKAGGNIILTIEVCDKNTCRNILMFLISIMKLSVGGRMAKRVMICLSTISNDAMMMLKIG